ncbi:hypothetical protein I8748_28525 [Nostoc sp. CENA67]|uniref:Uncharacterized protein n=1 Tax=Amazonocrinis nigriterrae CENA67 TaxID=2794033 RepID=A0A8J7HUY8_9NOST|nr:hypothetical protein [Amazonocrinis nigriterrae]MBH8566062.1 hypothetical protein [Amazonocrinis nigriterrae CENA67]
MLDEGRILTVLRWGVVKPYRDNLNRWLAVRLLGNMQRVVVARFRKQSEAEGYLQPIRRLIPDGKFLVVFDGDNKSEVDQDCR